MLSLRTASALAALVLALVAGDAQAQVAPAGFSLFQTDPDENVFYFAGNSSIPAGFFDPDSQAFEGSVHLGGDPLVRFQGTDVGNADTVVGRPSDATPGPSGTPGEAAPLELRALSLVGVAPIAVTG